MALSKRLPLAFRQLIDSPAKTAAAVAGICFSNVLVFFQLGLLSAIYQSQDRPYSLLDGEIVLVSSRFSRLSQTPSIWKSDVMRAQGVEGVDRVSSLLIGLGTVLVLPDGYTTNAQIYAIDPSNPSLDPKKAKLDLQAINLFERAAIDNLSRPPYVKNVDSFLRANKEYQTNIGNDRLLINSTASVGSTFAADLSLIMSQENFLHYFPGRSADLVNLGVVKLTKGYSVDRVLSFLNHRLYPKGYSIQAYSIQQVSALELDYWRTHTSLTFIFGLGVVVGFVVSGIILYQILYSDVLSHISEYATLLALGYTNIYVTRVVFTQALLLTLIATPVAIAISMALYTIMSVATNLVIYMTFGRAVFVLVLGSATSMFSCYLATDKLRKVDPSTLY
jgi:putative ABC transport system permease protein